MLTRLASLILALLVIAGLPAHATDYYVSPSGNDYLFGTSPTSPWASISRVNRADLRSGDHVYFLRGGTWRDTLQPQTSGIYYGAYGSGARPIISAADLVGNNFLAWWINAGANVWFVPVSSVPTQIWFNGVLGTHVATQAQVLAPLQWTAGQIFGCNYILAYSSSNPMQQYTAPGVEVSVRGQALLVGNLNGITAEHIAFVNGANVSASTSGQVTFNDDVFSGALNEGVSVLAGSATIAGSEIINNGMGINVRGGQGFTMNGSILSGNHNQAVLIGAAVAGPSSMNATTVSGNSTTNPASEVITNYAASALSISNSILLPNPYEPKVYNFSGITDAGNNVYQSPMQKQRAASLIVVPFIDDYNNLAVAQAVAQVANTYGCNLSYALNTKLVTPLAWSQIAAMQSSGVDIVAHTRSHSDLANNNVFSIQYTGTATKATMTIDQKAVFSIPI